VTFGSDSLTDSTGMLEYLVDIIETDGEAVNAPDSAVVVVAAIQAWTFIATFLEDLGDYVTDAMRAFNEQLESSDPDVQSAAGEAIAYIFEANRDLERDSGETFDVPYDPAVLIAKFKRLAQGSKSISRKDRTNVRGVFHSVITSLELKRGPHYSTALSPEARRGKITGAYEYGYRTSIRIGNTVVPITTWSMQIRNQMVKKLLGGGYPRHLQENPLMAEIFPDSPAGHGDEEVADIDAA
jgi:hypothetical protein